MNSIRGSNGALRTLLRKVTRRGRAAIVGMGLVLLAGCGGEEVEPQAAELPEYDGLTTDQIQSQAEPMTQEEAERLGIVDTTIRTNPPMNPDSVILLDVPQVVPADTAGR